MSGASPTATEDRWRRLPAWLRPREAEQDGGAGGADAGSRWLIETTLLVLAGLALAVATLNDVGRQVNVNHRLSADVSTWRHYTHHDYHNVSPDQELFGTSTQREVVCGNVSPGPPHERPQICLAVWGPVVAGLRTVHGGWYLPAGVQDDVRPQRYGCFGEAGRGECP